MQEAAAPWAARATKLRAQIAESLGLVSLVETKKTELAEARKLLKLKEKSLSEKDVQLQHANKQVSCPKISAYSFGLPS